MKKGSKNQSELQKVAIFLGVLLVLLVISFFVGMYLGPDAKLKQTPDEEKQTLTSDSTITPTKPDENSREKNLLDIYNETEEIKNRIIAAKQKPKIPKGKKISAGKQKKKTVKAIPKKAKKESIVYAVQVGAFRNAIEAKRLAKKLGKKGYTVYVVDVKTKDKGTLHKVRIGRFHNRKQADKLSRKIRKNEGIQAFVAYR